MEPSVTLDFLVLIHYKIYIVEILMCGFKQIYKLDIGDLNFEKSGDEKYSLCDCAFRRAYSSISRLKKGVYFPFSLVLLIALINPSSISTT